MYSGNPVKDGPTNDIPRLWTITLGGAEPFSFGARIALQPKNKASRTEWLFSVTPQDRADLILLGSLEFKDGVWSGNVQPDGEDLWFASFALTQRPENNRFYLYGIFLKPLSADADSPLCSSGRIGQDQGTWGAEEDDDEP